MFWKNWIAAAVLLVAVPAAAQVRPALLNPNTATEAQLGSMPHFNAPLAQAVIAKRPFAAPTDLDKVLAGSLNETQRQQLYTRLFVPLNLNTATADDIMLIPGMSRRMMGEFREYRPYRSIGQFRHEIGKYVNKDEVARLERYGFVPEK
ncbi:MAG: Photosystem 12 kDa extrinsic protein [Pseudomonadota bacterium]|jgi:DNA uptake protein ComE-like DNA-binding protein